MELSGESAAIVRRSELFQALPGFGYCGAGAAHPVGAGIIDSIGAAGACGEGVGGCRWLPQFKQKLSPGRVSALQKGHLPGVDVRPALLESCDGD